MKIHFTKKEYRLLIDMLSVSDWVMHSYSSSDDERFKEHEELRTKLYALSKEMCSTDIIEHDKSTNSYYEGSEYEESIHEQIIDPYEENVFWDLLIKKLSHRDLDKEFGKNKLADMTFEEKVEQMHLKEKPYVDAFDKNGLQDLKLMETA